MQLWLEVQIGVLRFGVDDGETVVAADPHLVAQRIDGTYQEFAERCQQPVEVVEPFAVLPSVELLALVVRQPADALAVGSGEERIGEGLRRLGIDDLHFAVDGHERVHRLHPPVSPI